MPEQVKRGGHIYVLNHDEQSALATEVKLGLNRMGHQIWVRERDEPDTSDVKAHNRGIESAGVVVVLETAALAEHQFARDLVEWAEEVSMVRPKFVAVEVERGHRMSKIDVPPVDMKESIGQLVHEIDVALEKLGRSRPPRPSGTLTGKPSPYVLLSYARSDAEKVDDVRAGLETANIEVWDYAVSPRQPTIGYQREIPAAIRKAKAVLYILTAAWLKSDFCQREFADARKSRRHRLWLRFEQVEPPEDCRPQNLIDFRRPESGPESIDLLLKTLSSLPRGR